MRGALPLFGLVLPSRKSHAPPRAKLRPPTVDFVLVLAVLFFPFVGESQVSSGPEPTGVPRDEFEVRLVPELILTLGLFGIGYLLEENKKELAGDVSCPGDRVLAPIGSLTEREKGQASSRLLAGPPGYCDANGVNPVDRFATELSVDGAADLSDVLLTVSLSGPILFAAADAGMRRTSPGGERFGKDFLVIAETYGATYLTVNTLKVIVRRLRPFNYDPRFVEARVEGDSRASFPSGHSALAFAGAATLFSMLDQRFPEEPWAIGTSIGGFLLATTVATSRVLAGRHFLSDVLVGAAIGTTFGLFIPWLHRGSGPPSADDEASVIGVGFGGQF